MVDALDSKSSDRKVMRVRFSPAARRLASFMERSAFHDKRLQHSNCMQTIKKGTYRHYKGGLYEVTSVAMLEATKEPVVVYTSQYDAPSYPQGTTWVRPLASFVEQVSVANKKVARFSLVKEATPAAYIILFKLLALPAVLFFINEIWCRYNLLWYAQHHVDTYMHFIGGALIAMSSNYALDLFEQHNVIRFNNKLIRALVIITMVVTTAVLWEFYEFILSKLAPLYIQQDLPDTMKDLLMGMLGSITYTLHFFKKKRTK